LLPFVLISVLFLWMRTSVDSPCRGMKYFFCRDGLLSRPSHDAWSSGLELVSHPPPELRMRPRSYWSRLCLSRSCPAMFSCEESSGCSQMAFLFLEFSQLPAFATGVAVLFYSNPSPPRGDLSTANPLTSGLVPLTRRSHSPFPLGGRVRYEFFSRLMDHSLTSVSRSRNPLLQ